MVTEKTSVWHLAAKTTEIDEDEPKDVRIGDLFLAFYKINNQYYATDDMCTHECASLSQGYVDGDVIECPLHQARFHIPTGKVVGPPATEDLRTYAVRVVGDELYVRIPED